VSLNLIGIFQIISVMNALFKVLSNSFWSYLGLENKEDELYNFYSFYFKESINEGIEFDLIETMSFLGMIFYDFYGYKISSILFMIPNGLSFFLIYMFFSEYNNSSDNYNLLQILYLFICYSLLFIGVGSSALLSQQMLINNYGNFITFFKQINIKDNQIFEDDQNNSFIFICVTSIIGSLIKYIFDIIISRKKYRFDKKFNTIDFYDINNNFANKNCTDNEINNIIYSHDKLLFFVSIICIYGGTIILSIILYFIFECCVYKDDIESEIEIICKEEARLKFAKITGGLKDKKTKEEISKDEKKQKICKFFSYLFYLDKIENIKKKNNSTGPEIGENKLNNDKEKKTDVIIDNEPQKSEEPKYQKLASVGELNNNYSQKCKYFIKTCKLFYGCFCNIFSNFKLLSNSLKNCVSEIICSFICDNIFGCKNAGIICPFCFWCECCYCCCDWCKRKNECCFCCSCCKRVNKCFFECTKPVEDKEYEQNEVYYLFCYKSERNLKWFDSFIKDETQLKFLPLLVEFFLIKLITIVFEIKVEENIEEGYFEFINSANIVIFILILISILFLFFVFTYLFGILRKYLKQEKFSFKCEEVSDIILSGTIGIVIVNSFFSLFASFYCLTKDLGNNFLYIPILMNKCYYFVFSNQCTVYTDSEDKIDYFSSATLLSVYLFILDLIMIL